MQGPQVRMLEAQGHTQQKEFDFSSKESFSHTESSPVFGARAQPLHPTQATQWLFPDLKQSSWDCTCAGLSAISRLTRRGWKMQSVFLQVKSNSATFPETPGASRPAPPLQQSLGRIPPERKRKSFFHPPLPPRPPRSLSFFSAPVSVSLCVSLSPIRSFSRAPAHGQAKGEFSLIKQRFQLLGFKT